MFCTHRRTEEERNLEKAKKLQEETKKRRLQNERNMAKVLKGKRSQPMRSVAVTRPKEFDFKVANKQREHNTSTRASSTPFEKKLRQETAVSVSKPFLDPPLLRGKGPIGQILSLASVTRKCSLMSMKIKPLHILTVGPGWQ